MNQAKPLRHILITGASSGIGKALALHWAAPGRILSLHGRDASRLEEVAAACVAKGAVAATGQGDVRDRAGVAAWIAERHAAAPLDVVVANAGVSGMSATDTIAINVQGVLNTVEPVVPLMTAQGSGTIAIVSSLAAWRGMPTAPAYGASKAAVRLYGEGLRGRLLPKGVTVCVVCPGFVETPLIKANRFPMPWTLDVETAARIIARGIERGRARIAFPWQTYALVRLLAALPPGPIDRLLLRFPPKE